MFLFPFLIEPFQKYHLKTNICHLSYRWGGIRKMFYSEKPKDLLWSIGSSYWFFNLGVHVGVMEKQIMAKNGHFWPFVTIFGNGRPSALFELNTGWTRLSIGGTSWTLLEPTEMVPGSGWSQGAPKTAISGHIWQYLTIGGTGCPIWVEHRLNKVEHCFAHLRELVGSLWNHWIRSCVVPEAPQTPKIVHYRGYLAIFGPLWLYHSMLTQWRPSRSAVPKKIPGGVVFFRKQCKI